MGRTNRSYDPAFKLEALHLCETTGRSASQIERELGITPGLLSKWRRQSQQAGSAAFPGSGHLAPEDAELRRLRRENEILRQERDILKKAMQVFAREVQP
jgi:transposase